MECVGVVQQAWVMVFEKLSLGVFFFFEKQIPLPFSCLAFLSSLDFLAFLSPSFYYKFIILTCFDNS